MGCVDASSSMGVRGYNLLWIAIFSFSSLWFF
jgi:hypothetical protein